MQKENRQDHHFASYLYSFLNIPQRVAPNIRLLLGNSFFSIFTFISFNFEKNLTKQKLSFVFNKTPKYVCAFDFHRKQKKISVVS